MDINDLIAIVKKKLKKEILIENINIEDKSFFSTTQSGFLHSLAKSSIIFITGTNPYDLIYEYNMYVCTDLATPMSPPSYNGREIKALKTILGNNQLDGRRIQEMSNDINGDFITNFLYKIFLRRYPVYDFSTTGTDGTEMGFVTDTYYNPQTQGSATQSFYNTGSWGTNMYVKKSILDAAGTELPTSEVTFFVFKGLRGDTPTYYNTL